jgi:hypothetical protein
MERSPQEIAANEHLKQQPAIQLLTQKVNNFAKYMQNCVDMGYFKDKEQDKVTLMMEKVNSFAQKATDWPFEFVPAILMLGGSFFDVEKRVFQVKKFEDALPKIKEVVSKLPGGEAIEAMDLTWLPDGVKQKTYQYITCFCDLLIPKKEEK